MNPQKGIIGRTEVLSGLIILMIISMFFSPHYMPPFTILLGVFTLLWGTGGQFIHNIKKNGLKIILFSSLFWVYLGGLLHSENMDDGILDVILKLSFFAFPFIFGVMDPKIFNWKTKNIILQSFVGLSFFSAFLCLMNATNNYFISGEIAAFFYGDLSYLVHPSYFALYINLSLGIVLWQLINERIQLSSTIKMIYFILIPFFILFIILLESKAGILGLISILITIAIYMAKYQGELKKALILISLSMVFIFALFTVIPGSTSRINSVVESVSEENSTAAEHSVASTRLYLWDAAWQLIQKNPIFGVGTGDVKDELILQYQSQNNTRALENNYNPHNQYLQTSVALGLLGFLSLLTIVLFPLYIGFKRMELLYFVLGVLMAINLLVESMFERQAGVMFFAFFNSFIFFVLIPEKKEE
ncbi:MAG: hypothetical protein GQ527_11095 [Bacteroidales bacterium]|nr:hypothetical protein [Bacteroidales bacterium]